MLKYILLTLLLLTATPCLAATWTIDPASVSALRYRTPAMGYTLPAGTVGRSVVIKQGSSYLRPALGVMGRFVTPIAVGLSLYQLYQDANNESGFQSKYPSIYDAAHINTTPPNDMPPQGVTGGNVYPVGSIHNYAGSMYRIGTPVHYPSGGCRLADCLGVNTVWDNGGTLYLRVNGWDYDRYDYPLQYVGPVPVTSRAATEPEFNTRMLGADDPSTPGVEEAFKPSMNTDVDNYVANKQLPSTSPTESDLQQDFSRQMATNDTAAVANNTATATNNANNAQTAVNQARDRYNANPTDTNYQTLKEAETAAAQAEQEKTKANSDQAKKDNEDVPPPPPPNGPSRKGINWNSWKALIGIGATIGPMSLLPSIIPQYQTLLGSGTAPVFNLPLMGQTIVVSLAYFDPAVLAFQYVFSFLLGTGTILMLVRFYRGVS